MFWKWIYWLVDEDQIEHTKQVTRLMQGLSEDPHHHILEGQQKPTIEQTAWVVAHVLDHMKKGGSYRHLIYDRFGHGPESYVTIFFAGGLNLSNLCPVKEEYDNGM